MNNISEALLQVLSNAIEKENENCKFEINLGCFKAYSVKSTLDEARVDCMQQVAQAYADLEKVQAGQPEGIKLPSKLQLPGKGQVKAKKIEAKDSSKPLEIFNE